MIIGPVVSPRLLPFRCCLLLMIICQASAVPRFLNYRCASGNSAASSTYRTNLNAVSSRLTSNTEIDYGFYNSSYGLDNNKVSAIGMCRGDVSPDTCRSCLKDATDLLTQICPGWEAVGWYEYCMLRYSNRSIFYRVETSPEFYMLNPHLINATDLDKFNQAFKNLMDKLRVTASAGDDRRKYAIDAANVSGTSFANIYGLAQCTPDLSTTQCDYCLAGAFLETPECCDGKRGGRVIKPSCNVRFELYPFWQPAAGAPSPSNNGKSTADTPSPSSNNNTSSEGPGKGSKSRTLIPIVVAAAVVLVLCFIYVYLRVRKRRTIFETDGFDEEIIVNESLQFDFDTIRVATSDFSDSNKFGQGGFGAVYKGRLSNGQMIAVKRLSRDSGQGAMEFKNEVLLLAKLQHRNLVKLLGFCLEGGERLLIYEFVPNKSLDHFIFDPIKKGQLNWISRNKIIEGVARALLYLHEDSRMRIIHRDLKPSNILLDEEMNPKISDFGLARLCVVNQTQGNTSRIVGTYGYMAPEYALYGQFSTKSDVFSFGVPVLQIVSGHKHSGASHGENVEELPLSFAWRNWRDGTTTNIVDPSLSNGSPNEMMRCIHIGLLCVQENLVDRPTMSSVVSMLKSYYLTLPIPSEPAFFVGSRTRSLPAPDTQSGDYNARAIRELTIKLAQESENEASITELHPR